MAADEQTRVAAPELCCGADCEFDKELVARLIEERDKARHLAKNLFQMIDRETWRATGGDDGQGHYEGEYRAAGIEEEIRAWQ